MIKQEGSFFNVSGFPEGSFLKVNGFPAGKVFQLYAAAWFTALHYS